MNKKRVFVVGGTRGIGLTIVEKFAKEGYDIVATYNTGSLKMASEICEKYNANLTPVKMDVSNYSEVQKGFEIAFKQQIDSVVCSSGISLGEKLLCDQSIEDIDKIIDVNLKGIIYCNREAQKHMLGQGCGSIVNISSIYGLYGGCCESAYSASKGGIIALTKALSDECAAMGVRVNAVAPGCIATDMTNNLTEREKEVIIDKTPLKRLGEPKDVANAVFFLAGEDSSFITGEVITVSGGITKF